MTVRQLVTFLRSSCIPKDVISVIERETVKGSMTSEVFAKYTLKASKSLLKHFLHNYFVFVSVSAE